MSEKINNFKNLHNGVAPGWRSENTQQKLDKFLNDWFDLVKNNLSEFNSAIAQMKGGKYPWSFMFELLMYGFLKQELRYIRILHPKKGSDFCFKFNNFRYKIECVSPEPAQNDNLMPAETDEETFNGMTGFSIHDPDIDRLILRFTSVLKTKAENFDETKSSDEFWFIAVDLSELNMKYHPFSISAERIAEILYNLSCVKLKCRLGNQQNSVAYREHEEKEIPKAENTKIQLSEVSFEKRLKNIDGVIIQTTCLVDSTASGDVNWTLFINKKSCLDKKFIENISNENFNESKEIYTLKRI